MHDRDTNTFVEPDDQVHKPSGNPHFVQLLHAGLSRRSLLRGGLSGAMINLFAPLALSACGGDDGNTTAPANEPLLACGDPLAAGVPASKNDGTDTQYAQRVGDCHDGVQYFGLSATAPTQPASPGTCTSLAPMPAPTRPSSTCRT